MIHDPKHQQSQSKSQAAAFKVSQWLAFGNEPLTRLGAMIVALLLGVLVGSHICFHLPARAMPCYWKGVKRIGRERARDADFCPFPACTRRQSLLIFFSLPLSLWASHTDMTSIFPVVAEEVVVVVVVAAAATVATTAVHSLINNINLALCNGCCWCCRCKRWDCEDTAKKNDRKWCPPKL